MASFFSLLSKLINSRKEERRVRESDFIEINSSTSSSTSSSSSIPSIYSPPSATPPNSLPPSTKQQLSSSSLPKPSPTRSGQKLAVGEEKEEEQIERSAHSLLHTFTPSPLRLECSICMDTAGLEDTLELGSCQHVFCKECIKGHCQAQQSDGKAAGDLGCPYIGCQGKLTQQELELVLGADHFQRLDRRALEQAVALDSTLHLCPTPDCPFVCSWMGPEDGPPRILCPICRRERCLICGAQPYHQGSGCRIASSFPPSLSSPSSIIFSPSSPSPSDDAARKAAEEAATLAFIAQSSIKLCPRCKNGVVKEEGCDKLKCRCGYRSCWQCGSENAQCACTPASHGFTDNVTGGHDFTNLRSEVSPT